ARRQRRGARRARGVVAQLPERRRRNAQGDAAARDGAAQAPPPPAQEAPGRRHASAGSGVTIAYVGIGSNLDDPRAKVLAAFDDVDRTPHTPVVCKTSA